MKYPLAFLLLPLSFTAISQDQKSAKFLYSDLAIKKLKTEIALKNQAFIGTRDNKEFFPVPQGVAAYLTVRGAKADSIKPSLVAGTSLTQLKEMHPDLKIEPEIFFVKIKTTYNSKTNIDFYPVQLFNERRTSIRSNDPSDFTNDLTGKWVFTYQPGSKYDEASLYAIFIKKEFQALPLPEPATRAIRYTDHLIDTTINIFRDGARENVRNYTYGPGTRFDHMVALAKKQGIYPAAVSLTAEQIKQFDKFIKESYQTALAEGTGSEAERFENYIEKYMSAEAALELKRRRKVTGGCSMDTAPIFHAANIARLAGETCCMDIFLRAHLNILNDRFERITDGSYAEPGRQTYGRELEEIGVNLTYLFHGTLITAVNQARNHYYGDLNRAGRALAELKSRKEVYSGVEQLIGNKSLDFYNKLLLVFFAETYNFNLKKSGQITEADTNLFRLIELTADFPDYIKVPLQKNIVFIRSNN